MWRIIAIACLIQATATSEVFTRRKRDVNPECHMNVSQLISYCGYPNEKYEVLTADGYYLTINRIPSGAGNHVVKGGKPAVLLIHGLLAEARSWIINMPRNSLGFVLADAGYDVWLGNCRGTTWSKKHQTLLDNQDEFWDFSFHEIAMYDLPAMINFILKKTGQKQLYYVGHSQGTTVGFIAFSVMPELSQKIKMFVALAPVVSIKHVSVPMLKLLSSLPEHTAKDIFGNKSYSLFNKSTRNFFIKLCSSGFMNKLCASTVYFAFGLNMKNLNVSRIDVLISIFPDTTSIKTLIHWKQTRESGFRYFDYRSENQVKYNQSCPPPYKIEDMTVPVVAWSGAKDVFASPEDTKNLLPRISNLVYHHCVPGWDHFDFIGNLNVTRLIYYKIIEFMGKSP
ncbi:putative lysosomal acid lipase/cholesteryl ester hydrolase [Hemicordylus capensis]|uniref:putative lysosomal acid lipase/cholesteryl ester hydrolase n=1 Tax=Hemicordylus capensis TaxID=884348 RepID=UPI002302CE1B|nr:putative lysosomal acid lipase/cholesteryl ester hydrolase [Hemicordylus capensis]